MYFKVQILKLNKCLFLFFGFLSLSFRVLNAVDGSFGVGKNTLLIVVHAWIFNSKMKIKSTPTIREKFSKKDGKKKTRKNRSPL